MRQKARRQMREAQKGEHREKIGEIYTGKAVRYSGITL